MLKRCLHLIQHSPSTYSHVWRILCGAGGGLDIVITRVGSSVKTVSLKQFSM